MPDITLINPNDPTGFTASPRHGNEVSQADLARVLGTSLDGGDPIGHTPGPDRRDDGYVYPPKAQAAKRAARLRKVDKFALGRLRDACAIPYPSPPEAVSAASRAGLDLVRKAQAAAAAIDALPDDAEVEAAQHVAAVEAAHAAGKPIPAPPATDWAAQDAIRRTEFTLAVKAAEAAVADYRQVVLDSREEWVGRLVGLVDPAWSELETAIAAVAKASGRWSAAKAGAHKMSIDLGRFARDTHRSSAPRTLEAHALAGVTALERLVSEGDVVTHGGYLSQDVERGKLPEHTIAAMRANASRHPQGADWWALAELDKAAKN